MTVRYHITPYDPAIWRVGNLEAESQSKSDLAISFMDFMKKIRQNWSEVIVSPPRSWQITGSDDLGVSGSFGGESNQILSLEIGKNFNGFVLWYRSYIPSIYPLFLFREGEWDSLRMDEETDSTDIAKFTGL